jgi:nitrate reductase gamma subunit
MYQFVTGPLAWISFGIFFIGLIVRTVQYFRGLSWQLDRVAYLKHLGYGIKGAVRSILYWIVPFGSHGWRFYPGFTVLVFIFHIGLLVTPIFLLGHNLLIEERWGFSFWTISEATADTLTIIVMIAIVFLVLRRIALPEVRIITTAYDYLLLALVFIPFFTGFLASHNVPDYQFWLIAHILSAEILLALIPFTKLSHVILFFTARAQLGMDYGIKRGGMKGANMPW